MKTPPLSPANSNASQTGSISIESPSHHLAFEVSSLATEVSKLQSIARQLQRARESDRKNYTTLNNALFDEIRERMALNRRVNGLIVTSQSTSDCIVQLQGLINELWYRVQGQEKPEAELTRAKSI